MADPSSLNRARRAADLRALADGEAVDLLVIGAGVSGAGVAVDAASRGLSVGLIDAQDLAFGTSRWSSKLVHGGLRYLAKGDVGIAHESAVERDVLMQSTAPHLIRALPMVTPIGTSVPRHLTPLNVAALGAAEALRMAAGTPRARLPRPRLIGVDAARSYFPRMQTKGVRRAFLTFDGQVSDDARLVVALARTAAREGAKVLTYCRAEAVRPGAVTVADAIGGASFEIRARHVINATGVWADTIDPTVALKPSKGVHLVFDGERLGSPTAALMVAVPGTISRYVFFLPQLDGRVILGLTDDLSDTIEDEAKAEPADVAFLLETANRALGEALTPDDVVGTYAGYRPLLAGSSGTSADLSRRHAVHEGAHGMLSLVGGKLTTYRRMAEDAVDALVSRPGLSAGPCRTRTLPLVGATEPSSEWLGARYGSEAPRLRERMASEPALAERVVPGLPYTRAELVWAVEHEGALTAADLLDRRTRIGFVPSDREAARPIAEQLAGA
ncbi:MAG: glycerol-3-phosphate dehydrogenase/oxidase [Deltaproteobacteria bacterium]|nr:glycerol-3-phosphate dehydrogenase/oxidase [Deltaproteobacteria bacterium]